MTILLILILVSPHFMLAKTLALLVMLSLHLRSVVSLTNFNVILLVLFGILYELSIALNGFGEVGVNAFTGVFLPPAIYLAGRIFAFKKPPEKVVLLIVALAITIAVIPLISIWSDILTEGFVGNSRNINLLWGGEDETSATVLGGYLTASLCLIALLWNRRETGSTLAKYAILIVVPLSAIAALRLGSRTQLIVFFSALILGFLLNAKKISIAARLFWAVAIGVAVSLVIYGFGSEIELLIQFADRVGEEESGFDSAGGRTQRWAQALEMLIPGFLGWPLERFGYAHNIFLDVARAGGFVPALALLVFYIRAAVDANWIRTKFIEQPTLRVLTLTLFVGISLVFFVEPILSGFYQLFIFFVLLSGFMSGVRARSRSEGSLEADARPIKLKPFQSAS